jgi:hypothetical protein
LGPAEIAFFHFLFVVLDPPVTILEERPHHDRVITFTDKIFVNYVSVREWNEAVLSYC